MHRASNCWQPLYDAIGGKVSLDRTSLPEGHYNKHTPAAPGHSHFRYACGQRHNSGGVATERWGKAMILYKVESLAIIFSMCKCLQMQRRLPQSCPVPPGSHSSTHLRPNLCAQDATYDLGKPSCANTRSRKLTYFLYGTSHGISKTRHSDRRTITSGNIKAGFYCLILLG